MFAYAQPTLCLHTLFLVWSKYCQCLPLHQKSSAYIVRRRKFYRKIIVKMVTNIWKHTVLYDAIYMILFTIFIFFPIIFERIMKITAFGVLDHIIVGHFFYRYPFQIFVVKFVKIRKNVVKFSLGLPFVRNFPFFRTIHVTWKWNPVLIIHK